MLNPIVYAVPVFLLLMALEWGWSRRANARAQPAYRAADTISSLSLGILSQIVGVFTKLFMVGIYVFLWEHFSLWRLDAAQAWVWVLALVFYDFLYYWHHRLGHTMAVLWAAHAVHHSSEEYNLSTALRQTSSGFLFGWIFYLPMALLGFPPLVYVVVGLIDLLYQFWVHTRLIGRLGWFDRWFCSPSNHRVHHGQNPYCLDRNYGGILMIWDRMFGTFVDEREGEEIVYGVLGPLRSWSPVAANLRGYQQIWGDMVLADNWRDKLTIWFRHPGWRPAAAERLAPKVPPDLSQFQRYAPALPPGLPLYGLLQLAVLLVLGVGFLALEPQLSLGGASVAALGLLVALWVLSRLMERGTSARTLERGRLLLQLLLAGALWRWSGAALQPWEQALLSLMALASAWGLLRLPMLLSRPVAEAAAQSQVTSH